jgi:hypothetical protein
MLEFESIFKRVQGAVGMRARRGDSIDTIEEDVIAPSGLPEAHKATLSLQASSHLEDGRKRYQRRQDEVRRRAGRGGPARGAD